MCDAMELEASSHPNLILEPFGQKLLSKNRSTDCTSSSVGLSSNGERRHEPPCRPSRSRMPAMAQGQWETKTEKINRAWCVCVCLWAHMQGLRPICCRKLVSKNFLHVTWVLFLSDRVSPISCTWMGAWMGWTNIFSKMLGRGFVKPQPKSEAVLRAKK